MRNVNLKLGEKIRNLRKARNLTQEELAELTQTSYKYIQRIEGKNPPDVRLSTIARIAHALEVKIASLMLEIVLPARAKKR